MEEKNEIYPKLFTWLFVGLLITFVSGYVLAMNPELTVTVLGIGFIPIAIIELVIAFVMGIRIRKMHPFTMKICYLIFSITTGITFSAIFLTYELTSMLSIFIITAAIFAFINRDKDIYKTKSENIVEGKRSLKI